MGQKVLSESQMREYVEQEVRRALMNENRNNTILSESISEALEENMTDEGILDWLKNLLGGNDKQTGNENFKPGISMEGIIGAILGRFFAPVLGKLLSKIGINPNSLIGSVIIKAASTMGGYGIGQFVDKKWDPIGVDNGGLLGLGKK